PLTHWVFALNSWSITPAPRALYALSLHDALPISRDLGPHPPRDLPDPGRAAGTGARGHRAGPPVVVGVPLPDAQHRDRQRAAPAGRSARRAQARRPRRDPQLLGAPARRQA